MPIRCECSQCRTRRAIPHRLTEAARLVSETGAVRSSDLIESFNLSQRGTSEGLTLPGERVYTETMTMTSDSLRDQTDARAYGMRLVNRSYRSIAEELGLRDANQAMGAVERFCRTHNMPVPGRTEARSAAARRGAARRHGRLDVAETGRRFGVEIEVLGLTSGQIADAVRSVGLSARIEDYNHQTRNHWKVTTDSSVDGYELVSPILQGESGKRAVRDVMSALRAAGGRVDRSCGFHVHHEVADLTGAELAKLVEIFAAKQATMDALVAPSRRGSGYPCGRLMTAEIDWYVRAFRATNDRRALPRDHSIGGRPDARYRSLNVHSYPTYGTVEFRQHQGTLNGSKAVAWIEFGQAVIASAQAAAEFTAEGAEFLTALAEAGLLSTSSATYLAERIDALA